MNETTSSPRIFFFASVAALGALLMIIGIFTKRGRESARWVRLAGILSAVFFLLWSLLTFHLAANASSLSPDLRWQLSHLKSATGAFGAGIFISVLICSLFREDRRRKH